MPAASIKTDNKIKTPIGLTTKLFFGLDSETLSKYGYETSDLSYVKTSDYRKSRRITGTKSREETKSIQFRLNKNRIGILVNNTPPKLNYNIL